MPATPASVLNIGTGASNNYFNLQYARLGDAAIVTKSLQDLAAGFTESPYFYTLADDSRVHFQAEVGAPTTAGSSFSRAELRETDIFGNSASWNPQSGDHSLYGTTRITSLPPSNPAVVIMQVFGEQTTADIVSIRTQLVSGSIRLRVRINGTSVTSPQIASPYSTNTEFAWRVRVVNGQVQVYWTIPTGNLPGTPQVTGTLTDTSAYFKLGLYNQSSTDSSTAVGAAEHRLITVVHPTVTKNASGAVTTALGLSSARSGAKAVSGTRPTGLALASTPGGWKSVGNGLVQAAVTALALSSGRTGTSARSGATTTALAVSTLARRVRRSFSPLGLTSTVTGGRNVAGAVTTTLGLTTGRTGVHRGSSTATKALGLASGLSATRHTSGSNTLSTVALSATNAVYLSGGSEPPPPGIEIATRIYVPGSRKPLRFIAQDIVTGEIRDWDVPLTDVELTYQLSGPTQLRATLGPEYREAREIGFDAWSTWIHVEESGVIRASCIVQPLAISSENLEIEATGVLGYPNGIPYLGQLSEIKIDPAEIVRRIWAHLQSYPDAKLGVTLDATSTPVKLGEPARKDPVLNENGYPTYNDDGTPKLTDVEAKPYELVWWEETDCGSEIDNLAKSTPFDFAERVSWNTTKTGVNHHVQIGYPRLGTKRFDLRFAEDENLLLAVFARETPDHYASQIIVRGKGEGRDSVRGYAGGRSPRRIRRVAAVTDKTIGDTARANALAKDELRRRLAITSISEIAVDTTHDNAPVGSWQLGDDILIQANIPYIGEIALWHRIISYTWSPDRDVAMLTVRRSDQFAYGRVIQ